MAKTKGGGRRPTYKSGHDLLVPDGAVDRPTRDEVYSKDSVPEGLNFELWEKQADAVSSKATELLYGGAASGGKSHMCRVAATLWCMEIPGLQVYFFRRLFDDLIKNHVEGPTGFRALLSPLTKGRHKASPLMGNRLAEVVQGEVRFWNGSKIFLCHLQHQKDLEKYRGPEFHVLFIEEATQFTEYMIRFLRGRMRIPEELTRKIPKKYKKPKRRWRSPKPEYYFPRAVYTSNPGGVGHQYLKRAFVKDFEPYEYHDAPKDDGGHLRQFIPAKVSDNPSVNIEEVKDSLKGLPPVLVEALLNGNWDAVVGAFFPEIDPKIHLVAPCAIPQHWTRVNALDWGACGNGDPFALGWFAISDGRTAVEHADGVRKVWPEGTALCYRIWYGAGLAKVTVEYVARGIRERERGDPHIAYRVAGGDIREKRGTGPSVYELFARSGMFFGKADQRRVSGWQNCRELFVGKNGCPGVVFFDIYEEELETIQSLQHDILKPNDCTQVNDHVAEMFRYFAMSRAYPTAPPVEAIPMEEKFREPTLDDLWSLRDKIDASEKYGKW